MNYYDNIPLKKDTQFTNLETFNPFNKCCRINSPTSLKICASNTVELSDLYHKSFAEINSKLPIYFR